MALTKLVNGIPVEMTAEEEAAFIAQREADAAARANRVPGQVTPLQMRKALRASGLRASVVAYLQTADEATVEAWEYATVIERDNEMIAGAAAALGKTTQEIDGLFRLAATL